MFGDGFLQDGGVVGYAVALGSEGAEVDPGVAWRQVGYIRRDRSGG